MKKYYEEHPKARKEHSEKKKKIFENPEAREKKLILMRAYNSKRKQRDEPIEKTKDI